MMKQQEMKQQELPKVRISDAGRKFLIGMQYGLLAVASVLMLANPIQNWSVGLLVVFIGATLFSSVLHTLMALAIGNICQGRLDRLDERERAARDHAFITAFQITAVVVSLAWVYSMVASVMELWLPEAKQIWILLWLIGMLIYGLPTSVAAWQMKNLED
jgi:hypothetical protein